jgi:hypothetical protein
MINKVQSNKKKASAFGGLHAVSELLNHIKFDELFAKHFGKLRKIGI